MAEEKDFVDRAVEEFLVGHIPQPQEGSEGDGAMDTPPPSGEGAGEGTPPATTDGAGAESPAGGEPPAGEPAQMTDEDVIKHFNRMFEVNLESMDKVKEFAGAIKKLPEVEEQMKVLPELVDLFEKLENPMTYFRDETEFKISVLTKDPRFNGKEKLIGDVLRNDLDKLPDVRVIELASRLKAREGVRNPLRAELRSMGVDPDDVVDDYENLDDDTKDLLKIRADSFREELGKLGVDIKPPTFEGTIVERLIAQKKTANEEKAANIERIKPVAKAIISEIKEIPVAEGFNFKLELTQQELDSYTEELTEILGSGKYDASSEKGQKQIYGALIDMLRSDYFEKAVSALSTHLVSQTEERMRKSFNNETPLGHHEPPVDPATGKDLMTVIAEQMIAQSY